MKVGLRALKKIKKSRIYIRQNGSSQRWHHFRRWINLHFVVYSVSHSIYRVFHCTESRDRKPGVPASPPSRYPFCTLLLIVDTHFCTRPRVPSVGFLWTAHKNITQWAETYALGEGNGLPHNEVLLKTVGSVKQKKSFDSSKLKLYWNFTSQLYAFESDLKFEEVKNNIRKIMITLTKKNQINLISNFLKVSGTRLSFRFPGAIKLKLS